MFVDLFPEVFSWEYENYNPLCSVLTLCGRELATGHNCMIFLPSALPGSSIAEPDPLPGEAIPGEETRPKRLTAVTIPYTAVRTRLVRRIVPTG